MEVAPPRQVPRAPSEIARSRVLGEQAVHGAGDTSRSSGGLASRPRRATRRRPGCVAVPAPARTEAAPPRWLSFAWR